MTKIISCLALFALITLSHASSSDQTCQVSEDCPNLFNCHENVCVHKELFPLSPEEGFGTFFIVIINAIMTVGGVAGAAAYLPQIQLIFKVNLAKASAIGCACVLGGGLANLMNVITKKDPVTDRYLINYDVTLIVIPALLVGVSVGSIITRVMPGIIAGLMFLMISCYAIYTGAFQLKGELKKERKEADQNKVQQSPQEQNGEAAGVVEPEAVVVVPAVAISSIQELAAEKPEKEDKDEKEYAKDEKEHAKDFGFKRKNPGSANGIASATTFDRTMTKLPSTIIGNTRLDLGESPLTGASPSSSKKRFNMLVQEMKFPWAKLRDLFTNILSIIFFGLIRGSKKFHPVDGVEWTCSYDFMLFGIGNFCFVLAIVKSIYTVLKWQKAKEAVNYAFLPQEPVLNKRRLAHLIIRSIMTGIIGCILCISGGMIIGPALSSMGMPAEFAGPTMGLFMVFAFFSGTFGSVLGGSLSMPEVAWYMSLSFMVTVLAIKLASWYIKRTGKQSRIVGLVLGSNVVGTLCLVGLIMKGLVEDLPKQLAPGSIC